MKKSPMADKKRQQQRTRLERKMNDQWRNDFGFSNEIGAHTCHLNKMNYELKKMVKLLALEFIFYWSIF